MATVFSLFDVDGDGWISRDELRLAYGDIDESRECTRCVPCRCHCVGSSGWGGYSWVFLVPTGFEHLPCCNLVFCCAESTSEWRVKLPLRTPVTTVRRLVAARLYTRTCPCSASSLWFQRRLVREARRYTSVHKSDRRRTPHVRQGFSSCSTCAEAPLATPSVGLEVA